MGAALTPPTGLRSATTLRRRAGSWSGHGETPLFCADAIADPLTGLTAAGACLEAMAAGGRWLLDVSMAGVCAGLAGPTLPAPPDLVAAEPRARRPVAAAPELGADTGAVLAGLGLEA